jgi:hypothetical protein
MTLRTGANSGLRQQEGRFATHANAPQRHVQVRLTGFRLEKSQTAPRDSHPSGMGQYAARSPPGAAGTTPAP